MKLFGGKGRGRSTPQAFFATKQQMPAAEPVGRTPSMVLGDPKDKYGMMDEQKEIPSPAHNGMEALTDPEPEEHDERPDSASTVEDSDANGDTEAEGERVSPETTSGDESKKRKKKKKKVKKKKKKASSGGVEVREEDGGIVVDRVPTAMEYESDDSIERMIDERSRYSRYTTEYDELDLEPFDDCEESQDPNDKYAATNDPMRQLHSVVSDDSNPPVWSSWDAEEEKNKTSKKFKETKSDKGRVKKKKASRNKAEDQSVASSAILNKPSHGEGSRKSRGGKYQDLREFRKSQPADSKQRKKSPSPVENQEEEYSPYTLPDFNSPMSTGTGGSKSSQGIKKTNSGTHHSHERGTVPPKSTADGAKKLVDQTDNGSRQSKGSNKSGGSKGSNKKSQEEAQIPLSNSEEWIAYNTFSGTFQDKSKESTKGSIPPTTSDTSSLTAPSKKYEKYTAMAARSVQNSEEVDRPGPPLEIPVAKPSKHPETGVDKDDIRGRSLIHSWSTSKDTASLTGFIAAPAKAHTSQLKSIPSSAEIKGSSSGSTTSSSRRKLAQKKTDKYTEIDQLHSTSTEARTNRSGTKADKQLKSEPAYEREPKQEGMYSKSLVSDNDETEGSVVDSLPISRGARAKRSQMKELDEYSVAISVQDDPAIVQCLKFYHCAAAASLATLTMTAASCLPSTGALTESDLQMLSQAPELNEVDKMRYRDQDLQDEGDLLGPVSPKVEIVLEGDGDDDSSSDDSTVDAPDLKAAEPNVSSYLREVTGLSLRLDENGTMEEKKQQPALARGRAMAAEAETDLSIREIAIPLSSSMKIQKRAAEQKRPHIDSDPNVSSRSNSDEQRQLDILGARNDQRESEGPVRRENPEKTEGMKQNDQKEFKTETKENDAYAPEIEIIDKQSSEDASRPVASKKVFSKIFSRFGRKKSTRSGTSAKATNE